LLCPLDECADDRPLVARSEVGAPARQLVLREVAHRVEERRLQAREREVEPGHARDREPERGRVSLTRKAVEAGAAGVAETEQRGILVERFRGGIVDRRAQARRAAALPDVEEQRVYARGEETEKRRLDGLRLEVERGDVPVEVVDRDERKAPRPRE